MDATWSSGGAAGSSSFVINKKYIMHIPIPFTLKSVVETYGGDYGGLTKAFVFCFKK